MKLIVNGHTNRIVTEGAGDRQAEVAALVRVDELDDLKAQCTRVSTSDTRFVRYFNNV